MTGLIARSRSQESGIIGFGKVEKVSLLSD